MKSILRTAALAFALSAPFAAHAGDPAPAASPSTVANSDPMICHTEDEIGSRIKRNRVCMHKSEWEAQRQDQARSINRSQVQRGYTPAG